jgi:hypothetical protein
LELQEVNLDLCIYQGYHIHGVHQAVSHAQVTMIQQPALLLVYLVMFIYFLTIPAPLLAQAHSLEFIQQTHVRTVMLRA